MLKRIVGTLAALSFVLGASSAFGAAKASLFLVGEVPLVSDLFVNPTLGGVDTLDVVNGEAGRLVATVDETSNNVAGYTISIGSTNAGNLQHNDAATNVPYTIAYDGAAAVAVPAAGAPVVVKTSGVLAGLTTATSNVNITIAGVAALKSGAYTDTLVFTMIAL